MLRLTNRTGSYEAAALEYWLTCKELGYRERYYILVSQYRNELITSARILAIDHGLDARKYTVLAPITQTGMT